MQHPDLKQKLYEHFGYRQFREGQQEIIEEVMKGVDVLGILPTGTGKSICFQLPALLSSGTTIVVSPLISLMVDQVKQLKATGFKSVISLNSFMDQRERRTMMGNLQQYSLIYLSPEMLQNEWVQQQLKKQKVDLFVIDEAHCISQWGHEFRTDYLKLKETIELLNHPTVLALSATATPEVQADIKQQLDRPDMTAHIYPMDKVNMSFAVEEYDHPDDKLQRIIELLANRKAPTMIYFSSRQSAERISQELKGKLDQRVAFYHGGMEQMDRLLVQQQFMNDQVDVICCTSAFGMGVDKPNIRRVIHYHFPSQLESFIQEVGRAGRDGKPCASLMLYTPADHYLPQLFIQSELPELEDVSRVLRSIYSFVGKGEVLLSNDDMAEQLQLSESQWNFFKYQLEQENLLSPDSVTGTKKMWKQAEERIRLIVQQRWTYKKQKLQEMLNWLHHPGCKRKMLYASFQKLCRTPDVPCCSYCGFIISEMLLEIDTRRPVYSGWKERLEKIFHQGAASCD
ncbi:RecQ family ATP-dependent DNA helicase [Halobacillus amylolyticus]|uniref:RecQ family ATP-dependent DNA helicase n=1 Tax=Halobacillus amylolyticus TaxID=2932259 RepID=A0ABY4HC15_9BACI|nr:RecQ family ATP-dependent DNA helicase [Halobacillus amylolyticus]UOR12431.1 RecQ family ATP-dependent DNA helicase [Halobacillus amylolyticus]